ncbi:hypothetical protein EsDP_00006827 [Epichloe bromicola]|uniref:Ubiquitin-like domain-containing protein n=1 Tax=Epichloe bromicola TaxID=79588 RepID=A0ABQ0CYR8_9HYPO
MGCCFSRSSGPNSPYPGVASNASARHINPPPLSLPDSVQSGTNSSPRRRHRDQRALHEHINKPLRQHKWASPDRRWTSETLRSERIEFFDTRVTGRPEIWQTIRTVVDVLQESSSPEAGDEDSNGLATAQSILSAAEISLPTGDLADGVYDSFGNYYQLPQWVISDPTNLVVSNERHGIAETSADGDDGRRREDAENDSIITDTERRQYGKGKGALNARDEITLRARLSETGRDFDVAVSKSDSVGSVTRKLVKETLLSPEKKIRLAYMGKMLAENQSLGAQGWQIGHVVNALVFNR